MDFEAVQLGSISMHRNIVPLHRNGAPLHSVEYLNLVGVSPHMIGVPPHTIESHCIWLESLRMQLEPLRRGCSPINLFLTELTHWADSVLESQCPSMFLFVCAIRCSFYWGLSLALISYEISSQAPHWSMGAALQPLNWSAAASKHQPLNCSATASELQPLNWRALALEL